MERVFEVTVGLEVKGIMKQANKFLGDSIGFIEGESFDFI